MKTVGTPPLIPGFDPRLRFYLENMAGLVSRLSTRVDAIVPATAITDTGFRSPVASPIVGGDPFSHVLATTSALGPKHTVSGLTARQVLIASAADAALFRALQAADIPALSYAPVTHNILSATHGDTLAASLVVGSMLIVNADGKLALLSGGTEGQVPKMGAVVPAWAGDLGGAPFASAYVTIGNDATLSAERALTMHANANLVMTDQGAGTTVTLDTIQGIKTSSSPTFVGLTLTGNLISKNCFLGEGATAGYGWLSYQPYTAAGQYALLMYTSTFLNAPTGGSVYFRINNATQGAMNASGWAFGTGVQVGTTTPPTVAGFGVGTAPLGAGQLSTSSDLTVGGSLIVGQRRILKFSISGTLTTGTNKRGAPWRMRYPGTFVRASLQANTAPTGASIIYDIHKGTVNYADAGTVTIFSTQANRPAIVASAYTGNTTTFNTTTFAAGDLLFFDCDQIGSTIAGADLEIIVEVRQTGATA
jgi:hypothetical protein